MPSAVYASFEEAINDKRLFKRWYDDMSFAQQTAVRVYYGLPLETAEHRACWAMFNGAAQFDELGYPTSFGEFPYQPGREFDQLWAIIGRRGGKTTLIGALIFAYEVTLGGHLAHVLKGQTPRAVLVSQMKDVAIENLRSIQLCLESSFVGTRELQASNSDHLVMRNGISIVASSPNIKAQRGLAIPVAGLDEVGFWYKDAESANPDFEVVRAISAAQAQFPRRKRFAISSVWSKEGLLWEHHRAGTEGRLLEPSGRRKYRSVMVLEAPSAAMVWGTEKQQDEHGRPKQPHLDRQFLADEQARDPEGFKREYLGLFVDSVSQFIRREALEGCVQQGVAENLALRLGDPAVDPLKGTPIYVAVMDPAFRRDAYAFVIVHHERGRGVVVDKLLRFLPKSARNQEKAIKLNPEEVMQDILVELRKYGITHFYSDQYQLETLQQLYAQHGVVVEGFDFTVRTKAQICLNLESLVNTRRVALLDPSLHPNNLQLFEEVVGLEKVLRPNGTISIAAPAGGFDDMAMALALAAFKAMWLVPAEESPTELPKEHQVRTMFQRVQAQLQERKDATEENDVWD